MRTILFAAAVGAFLAAAPAARPREGRPSARVTLAPCRLPGVDEVLRCGVLHVPENRATGRGRTLPLRIVVLPARRPNPALGPIFYLAGGPGETATDGVGNYARAPEREEMDLVFVDQRGTGEGHFLGCPPPGSDDNLENYLKGPFDLPAVRACRDRLARAFDLSRYGTAAWIEDLDEVRRALGYDRINLSAGSFGTYAAQRYIRRYGRHVRAAYLLSPVVLANRTPLYMPRDGQAALERLFARCEGDSACRADYPRFRGHFALVLARMRQGPVEAVVRHPATGARTTVRLTEAAFVDAMRVFLYSSETARRLPRLIEQAAAGDYGDFADAAVRTVRNFYGGIRMGVGLAVTCNEFVNRISDAEVAPAAAGSFLGRFRIDAQRAACAEWPRTARPRDDLAPFRSDVPALLVTGDTDPVAPPSWADRLRSAMPNALHLTVPGAGHTAENPCIDRIRVQFFRAGTVSGLDTACMAELAPEPFERPAQSGAGSSASRRLASSRAAALRSESISPASRRSLALSASTASRRFTSSR
jgi:pimeloyl-ACP methyl ester carboxylesterase